MSSIILDDHDSLIVYSPGWVTGGLPTEYNSTTTYTDGCGANASITFRGVRIGVYGTIGSSNSNKTAPQSEYLLDGNRFLYQPTLTPLSQRNQRFYQSPELAKDVHTLVVTNLINGSSWLFLDYFVILTGETTTTTTSTSSDISATAMPNTMPSGGPPNQNIAIIAGTVGGTVVLSLLLFLVFLWRRRRKLECDRNISMVQSAWMEDMNYWTPASPPFRPHKIATTVPSTFTSPLVQSKTLRITESLPSTSNHPPSSVDYPCLPAPPEYKP